MRVFGDMNCAIRTVQRLPKLKKRIVRPNFGDQISKHSKQGKNYKETFRDKSFIRTNIYKRKRSKFHRAAHWICPRFPWVQLLSSTLWIANWSDSSQLGFLNIIFIHSVCLYWHWKAPWEDWSVNVSPQTSAVLCIQVQYKGLFVLIG